MSKGRCRDCDAATGVPVGDWGKSSKPRCPACGGLLDRLDSRTPSRRTPRGKGVRCGAASRQPDVNRRQSL